jgi:hypothetical protein
MKSKSTWVMETASTKSVLRDRLNTRNLLRRKNMHLDDYSCVLCFSGTEETAFHLFFECSFSQDCWSSISISWNLSLPPLDMVIDAQTNFGNAIFRELFITACWVIWTMRNSVVFDNEQVSLNLCKRIYKDELDLVCIKANEKRQAPLSMWRDSFHV